MKGQQREARRFKHSAWAWVHVDERHKVQLSKVPDMVKVCKAQAARRAGQDWGKGGAQRRPGLSHTHVLALFKFPAISSCRDKTHRKMHTVCARAGARKG